MWNEELTHKLTTDHQVCTTSVFADNSIADTIDHLELIVYKSSILKLWLQDTKTNNVCCRVH